ncbi:MAG: NUDIX domain-containing protein [Lentisphaeraceae bacterium]|nr:NUDIX domain-containing protein [Lentisphaeraceae bacterium]
MHKVMSRENIEWIPYKNTVDFYLCEKLPQFEAPVTTVHGFFFKDDKLLLVRHKKRGWEVPGGHIDENEDFSSAMYRELLEEAQMTSTHLHALGYLKKSAREQRPDNCPYPHPLSYCIFYSANIETVEEFTGDKSIVDARFFSLEQAVKIAWIVEYKCYFDEALKRRAL